MKLKACVAELSVSQPQDAQLHAHPLSMQHPMLLPPRRKAQETMKRYFEREARTAQEAEERFKVGSAPALSGVSVWSMTPRPPLCNSAAPLSGPENGRTMLAPLPVKAYSRWRVPNVRVQEWAIRKTLSRETDALGLQAQQARNLRMLREQKQRWAWDGPWVAKRLNAAAQC